jgi:hypothetical protein
MRSSSLSRAREAWPRSTSRQSTRPTSTARSRRVAEVTLGGLVIGAAKGSEPVATSSSASASSAVGRTDGLFASIRRVRSASTLSSSASSGRGGSGSSWSTRRNVPKTPAAANGSLPVSAWYRTHPSANTSAGALWPRRSRIRSGASKLAPSERTLGSESSTAISARGTRVTSTSVAAVAAPSGSTSARASTAPCGTPSACRSESAWSARIAIGSASVAMSPCSSASSRVGPLGAVTAAYTEASPSAPHATTRSSAGLGWAERAEQVRRKWSEPAEERPECTRSHTDDESRTSTAR